MVIFFIIFLGILCVIFSDQIADFLVHRCHLDDIMDLDRFFLPKQEWNLKKQQQFFLSAPRERLLPFYNTIIRQYSEPALPYDRILPSLQILPSEIFSFFEKYSALCIDHRRILDVKIIKTIQVEQRKFIVIGRDPDTLDYFIVESVGNNSQSHPIFQITNMENVSIELTEENSYKSFCHFVCFITSHYLEKEIVIG